MHAVGRTPRRAAPGARIYGLRLLYHPRGRARIAIACAILAVLDYTKEAVQDIGSIEHRPLQFDFGQFLRAAHDLVAGRSPYDYFVSLHCHDWCLGGYIYTPLFAEMIRPLAQLPLPQAAAAWLLVSHLTVVLTAVLLWSALRDLTTRTALAMMLAAGLLFQPLFENLSYVQIGTLMLLCLAAAAALHLGARPGRNALAGALVGFVTVLKVTPLVLAPALLPVGWAARGGGAARLKEGLAGMAGMISIGLILVLGMLALIPHTVDFFTQVLPHIGGGTTAYENKSFPAFVGRVGEWASLLLPGMATPAPDSRLVTVGTLLLFIGPVAWLAARRIPRPDQETRARAAAFAAYVAAMPIVSTITWRHHLVVNILAMALLLPALWPAAGPGASRAARRLVVLAYALSYIPQDLAHEVALGAHGASVTLADATRVLVVEDLSLLGMVALWLACVLALRGVTLPATNVGATVLGAGRPAVEGA